jgi:hypothetical protein
MMGVWPATTIFIPEMGDVDVPVGGFIIFSGSTAHAGMGLGFGGFCVQVSHYGFTGSGYTIGNRRLHFYFFSTNTWVRGTAPVDKMDDYRSTITDLNNPELSQIVRDGMETKLLGLLNVYDVHANQKDAFNE